jgi:hypothetical protein
MPWGKGVGVAEKRFASPGRQNLWSAGGWSQFCFAKLLLAHAAGEQRKTRYAVWRNLCARWNYMRSPPSLEYTEKVIEPMRSAIPISKRKSQEMRFLRNKNTPKMKKCR